MLVGIDPDLSKSGVAVNTNGKIEYTTMEFYDLTEWLEKEASAIKCVYLEAGWLNKSIHHFAQNKKIAGNIGAKVGANHTIGQLIHKYLERKKIKCVLVRPTTSKFKAEQFKKFTKIETRTNQEERDAVLLIWGR